MPSTRHAQASPQYPGDTAPEPASNRFRFSLKLGTVLGIPIYIHWTFWILILWIAANSLLSGEPISEVAGDVGCVFALFACVVLHELGHALAAMRYGVPTSDITLLPIGGVARLKRIPEKPSQEFVVAIAGPLVNVVIAAILYVIGARLPFSVEDSKVLIHGSFLDRLLLVNLVLVVFNLLPAFPMDGGRILRSLLAMTMDYGRATSIAATIGQLMALVFVFVGLQVNPFLILIALFVWIGAQNEAAQVGERIALRDIPVRAAMQTDYATIDSRDTLGDAAEQLLAGHQQDFPVADSGQITGVLTRDALLAGLAREGRTALVGAYATPGLAPVEAETLLTDAVAALREHGQRCMPVTEAGRTIGLLTLENIAELLMVNAALSQAARKGP